MELTNRNKRTGGRVFNDLQEIFQNNTKDSLWLLIENKVYDVTNFNHPGKQKILLMNSGTDATQAFEDIGHSPKADEWLNKLYIGDYVDPQNEKPKQKPPKGNSFTNSTELVDRLIILAVLFCIMLVVVSHYHLI